MLTNRNTNRTSDLIYTPQTMPKQPINSVQGGSRTQLHEHCDSSTWKQLELDRIMAAILQAIEDRRADELQVWAAAQLQAQYDLELKSKWTNVS